MANVKSVVETDVAQTLRASKDVQRAQDKIERGFEEMGDAAQRANAETQAALKQTAAAYELAENRMSSVRTRGATSRTVGGARSYALAPVASAPAHVQPFIPRFPGGGGGGGGGRGGGGPRGPEPFGGIYQTKAEDDAHTEVVRRRWRREAAVRLGRERQAAEAEALDSRRESRRQRMREAGRGAAYVGTMAGAYVGVQSLRDYDEQRTRRGDDLIERQRMLAPLMGVGQNYQRRGEITREVLAMASGTGIDATQIADARFGVESAASDLAPEVGAAIVRESAKFFKLQGSDMNTTARALTAAMTLVGDELEAGAKGVREFANELGYAADAGAFEINEVTPYLGMVLGAFKGMGYTRHDAEASMLIASRGGARPEQFSTATRNMALLMAEGEAKGTFKRTGTWAGDVRQLSAMESPELLDTFGRDAFTVAKMLVDNADALEMHTAKLREMTGEMDVVGNKLLASWQDTSHATAEILQRLNETIKNTATSKADDPQTQQDMLGAKGIELGVEETAWAFTPEWWKQTRKIAADAQDKLSATFGDGEAGDMKKQGVASAINKMVAAGDVHAADMFRISQGSATGLSYTTTRPETWADRKTAGMAGPGAYNTTPLGTVTEKYWTGMAEAEQFMKMKVGEGFEAYDMRGDAWVQNYLGPAKSGNQAQADAWLAQRRTPNKRLKDAVMSLKGTPVGDFAVNAWGAFGDMTKLQRSRGRVQEEQNAYAEIEARVNADGKLTSDEYGELLGAGGKLTAAQEQRARVENSTGWTGANRKGDVGGVFSAMSSAGGAASDGAAALFDRMTRAIAALENYAQTKSRNRHTE